MADEGEHGGAGGVGGWPDGIDFRLMYRLADYHWTVKRSLRAAAFRWEDAGRDERAAFLDELGALREREAKVWATHFARPVKEK